jgi:hypothetical protein
MPPAEPSAGGLSAPAVHGQAVTDGRVALKKLPVIVAEFAPNPVGLHLEVFQLVLVAVTPGVLQDHAPGADLYGMAAQEKPGTRTPAQ